jgi:hypothetical protein
MSAARAASCVSRPPARKIPKMFDVARLPALVGQEIVEPLRPLRVLALGHDLVADQAGQAQGEDLGRSTRAPDAQRPNPSSGAAGNI